MPVSQSFQRTAVSDIHKCKACELHAPHHTLVSFLALKTRETGPEKFQSDDDITVPILN